jgi:hypothetical protein
MMRGAAARADGGSSRGGARSAALSVTCAAILLARCALLAFLAVLPVRAGAEDSAVEWLRRSQAARFPARDMRATFIMYIEQKEGPRLKRRGLTLRRNREGDLADRLFIVQAPENLKELALLSQDQAGAPAAQWLYMPVYRRARRISIQAATDAFVGSDFMYVDFGRVRIEAGEHRVKGSAELDGRPCVVVETVTRDPSQPYRTLLSTLDRENALPLRLEYFDEKDELTRVGIVENIAVIEGWPTPVGFSVRSVREGSRSVLKLANVDYEVGLDPSLFTVESLEGTAKER